MTVYDRAIERLDFIFDRFDNIYVAFSGGKDSGVLLNLVADYMRDRGITRRIGIYHMDYEAQYQQVTDYVERTLQAYRDNFDIYHVCMPVCAQSAVSITQGYWVPWESSKRELWVRDMPSGAIHEDNHQFGFWRTGMTDYEFQMDFAPWYQKQSGGGRTIVLTGIRAQESHVRYMRTKTMINKFEGQESVLEMANGTYQGFPIYDWITEDIWTANALFGWDYNEIYDLYYYAGLTIDQMRVASPFNDAATSTLKLYKTIDPNTWAKMVGRVNGVNFAGIYGGTTAMGWKSITLPEGHTWKSYAYFLLDTLPAEVRQNYLDKLNTSIKFWTEQGGVLEDETIAQLEEGGVAHESGVMTRRKTDKTAVRFKEYPDDLPVTNFQEVPTFKRLCVCIMKNDHTCKYMGFTKTKEEEKKRRQALDWYSKL